MTLCWGHWRASRWGLLAWGANHVIRQLELSVPLPGLEGKGEEAEGITNGMANDLISCAFKMKPPSTSLRVSGLQNTLRGWEGGAPRGGRKLHALPLIPCSLRLFHLALPELSLLINQSSSKCTVFLSSVTSSRKLTKPEARVIGNLINSQ